MTICYIPTMGRVGEQSTYNFLAPTGLKTILVCPPDEVQAHVKLGYPALGCPAKGITATRQWIMDQPYLPSKVMLFDDDLRFAVRRFDDRNKFKPTELSDRCTMLDRLETMLDQVPLVGLCNRGGANNTPDKDIPVAMNKRLFDVQCFDTEWFHRERIKFRQPFMEDFDVCLQAHLKGFPSAMLTTHTKDNVGGANAGGGCSMYRTLEGQAEAARTLAARYPAFVSLREVAAKKEGEWGTRLDVKVMWVQAAKAGVQLRELLGLDQHPTPDWSDLAPEWSFFL